MIYCQFCHSSMKQINESTGVDTYFKTYACTNPESLNANANVAGGWTRYMGDYS